MRVILLSDQRHLGKRGEVVDVKPGHGRNYLLPQGLALAANDANIKYFEHQRVQDRRPVTPKSARAPQEIANRMSGLRIEIPKRVGETDTLYGSVTAGDIAEHPGEARASPSTGGASISRGASRPSAIIRCASSFTPRWSPS